MLVIWDKLIIIFLVYLMSIFMKHSKVNGAYCLGIFQNENDPTTLLGGMLCFNKYVFLFYFSKPCYGFSPPSHGKLPTSFHLIICSVLTLIFLMYLFVE